MKDPSFTKGVLYTLLSATGLSFVALLGKFGGELFSLSALIFFRYIVSFIFCLILLIFTGSLRGSLQVKNIRMHFLRAFFTLSAQYCFFYYMQKDSLLDAIVLLNTGPLFIPIIEWLVLRNKIGKSTWISVFISFIGVMLILQPETGIFSLLSIIGLMAGLNTAASQIVFGINSQSERSDTSVLYLFFICTIVSFFPYIFSPQKLEIDFGGTGSLTILFMGIMSVANQLFRATAYKHSAPSKLSPFLYISVVLGGIFDWMFFHNPPNLLSILGAALVILGGFLKIYLRAIILRRK